MSLIELGISLAKGSYHFCCFIKDIYCAVSEHADAIAETLNAHKAAWAFLDLVFDNAELGKSYLANRQHCSQLV